MDKKREFYITVYPKLNIDIKDVVGKIEIFDSTLGNMLIDRLNKGEDFSIKPFGTGERDEKGKLKTFNLLGFTIRREEYNYDDIKIDFSR
jgi:hypothetical protein